MRRTAAVVAALSLVVACGGDPAGVEHDDWRSLLERLPAPQGDGGFYVDVIDYEAARAALGIEQPADEAAPDEIARYMVTLQRGPLAEADAAGSRHSPAMAASFTPVGSWPFDVDQWRSALGFSALDVDRVAVTSSLVKVFQGRIDPDQVAAALTAGSGGARRVAHRDVPYHTWDGLLGPDDWHGALTVGDGMLVQAGRVESVLDSIDASQVPASALAGIEEVQLAADAATAPGVYAMFMELWPELLADAEQFDALATLSQDELLQRARDVGRLVPFQVAAASAGLVADQPFVMLALVHPIETAADANAVLLEEVFTEGTSISRRQPWDEHVEVASLETHGRVAVIRLHTTEPKLYHDIISQRDLMPPS